MPIFDYDDYRALLRDTVRQRKAVDSSINFQQMGAYIRVPKSYLSKVVNGSAHLSTDQAYLVARYLKLSEEEQAFFLLLVDYARTALDDRRRTLLARIHATQAAKRQTHEHLAAQKIAPGDAGLAEYYLEPLNQIVHICLSIPRYASDLARLAKDLGVANAKLLAVAAKLEKLGIITKADGGYKVLIRNIHLAPDSAVYKAWRAQLKLMSLARMEAIADKDTYSFSAVFSTMPAVRQQIHAKLLACLSEIEQLVRGSPQEETYQLAIDLFPWT
jgi:uncharacterized protein (TIGR02147 family)